MAWPHDLPLPKDRRVPTWHLGLLIAAPVLALGAAVLAIICVVVGPESPAASASASCATPTAP